MGESLLAEYVEALGVLFVLCVVVTTFIVSPFYVSGHSMEPTLEPGDRIFVNKFIYRFCQPCRGDVVVFFLSDGMIDYIKRVAGTAGDEVLIKDGILFVNGREQGAGYVGVRGYGVGEPFCVERGFLYLLGDNGKVSVDSRLWGGVGVEHVVGKVFFRYMPLNKMGRVR